MPSINPIEFENMVKKAQYYEQELKAETARKAELQAKYDLLYKSNAELSAAHGVLASEKEAADAHKKKKKKGSNKLKLKEKRAKTAAAKAESEEVEAAAAALADLQREENLEVYRNVSAAYRKIADELPEITLKRVLVFQNKYIEADADSSGLIDAVELMDLLTVCCKQTVDLATAERLITEVDLDDSGQLDFVETILAGDKFMKGELKATEDMQPKRKSSKKGEKDSKACVIS